MKRHYDAIIVGAGIGGLTVANYLIRHGVETVLLEQNDHVGGYVTSFQRGRYRFDAGLTSFGSNGIVLPILQELGMGDDITLVPATRRFITDHFSVRVDETLQPLAGELARVFPHEADGIRRYFQWVETMSKGFQQFFALPVLLGDWTGSLSGLLKLGLREYPFLRSLLMLRNRTKQEIHRRYFRDPELIGLLDHQGYPVMTAPVLAGMWYSFVSDYWYPIGGMGGLSSRLWNEYTRQGGETYLRTKVEQILVAAGRVRGVRLSDGCEVFADTVFTGMDLRSVYLELLRGEYGGAELLTELRHAHPSESAFSLFLGLKGKGFHRLPIPLDTSHNWFYLTGEDGRKREFALNIPTREDPALVPEGESVIMTCFEEYDDWAELQGRERAYRARKEERVKEMLTTLCQVWPFPDERLEVIEAASPLTFERYSGGYKGATAGWSWNPRYQPRLHWRRGGRVSGLYHTGQWLYNPGGVPAAMLTARSAARSFLKKLSDFGRI